MSALSIRRAFTSRPLFGSLAFRESFNSAVYLLPVYVLQKSINIFRRCRTVIHVVGMFVHVKHELALRLSLFLRS